MPGLAPRAPTALRCVWDPAAGGGRDSKANKGENGLSEDLLDFIDYLDSS